jgi:transcriptional antiterminator RfaH
MLVPEAAEFLHFEPAMLKEGSVPDLKWFCLRIAPKQEHLAIAHLRKVYGIEVFCPRLRFQKATRTGRRWYVEALFPSYLFGRFDYLTQHRAVQYCSGVSTIVHFGSKIIPVPERAIRDLQSVVPTGEKETITIQPEVRMGEEVQVVEGAFAGLKAVVTRIMPARQRVAVLLEFLGRLSETEVPVATVLPTARHPLEGVPEEARRNRK